MKSRGFLASGLSTYDFSTLYTTLPHNLIKEKLTELIEQTFNREGSLYLAFNDKSAFFTSEQPKRYKLWSCQKMCDVLHYLLDNIFIRFGSKLYRQIVGILMGTNCAPLVADLFLFCYERDFMLSLSDTYQADIIEAFNSTSRYLDDLLNIDNPYFEQMVGQIYPTELQLNKANYSDTEAPFFDLNLSITNGIVSSKIYDKRDDFNFDIVNFPFLDGDVTRSPSHCVYISQLIRFARVCSNVDDFNNRNLYLTAKLLKQGYRHHKIRKAFSKFYYRHSELIVKYNIGLKTRLWCLTVSLSLSHWYPGSGVVLDCIDSWSLHPYLLWRGWLLCSSGGSGPYWLGNLCGMLLLVHHFQSIYLLRHFI